MAKKTSRNPTEKGQLFIMRPTLDMLLSSCDNVKRAADIGGTEYSNFVKSCKLGKDLRISTYQKCATAFGKDTLIIHLPCGLIDSLVTPKVHLSHRFHTIEEKDLTLILRKLCQMENSHLAIYFECFLENMAEPCGAPNMAKFLTSMIEFCQKLLEEYGNE